MSIEQLTHEAMALPLSERTALAQVLWQSIETGLAKNDADQTAALALKRDEELSSEVVAGRSHEDVMQAARHAVGCG
jgi:hypothetical protein